MYIQYQSEKHRTRLIPVKQVLIKTPFLKRLFFVLSFGLFYYHVHLHVHYLSYK
jgi:hypothetical protein